MLIDRRLFHNFDWILLGLALLIPMLGLVVLYSAGYNPDIKTAPISWIPVVIQSPAFLKQMVFLGLGVVVMIVTLSIPPNLLQRVAYPAYGFCVFMLLVVLQFGKSAKGSQRWFDLGPIHLQPSELMKPALILAMALFLSRRLPPAGGYGLKQLILPLMFFGFPMILIARQPDLGTALAVGWIGFSMIFFMGIRWKILLVFALVVLSSLYPAWHSLRPYQQNRVLTLIDPEADAQGSGYHIIQSKIAVGSGSFFGKGYLKGTQTQLEFLPEHTTDFIFSCLAEEWGFAGSIIIVGLYLLLLSRMLRVVARSRDPFMALLAFGCCSLFFFHTTVNIGMVIGLLPVVGVPLPLFSYGGSAMLASMFGVGILLGVSMRRKLYVARV